MSGSVEEAIADTSNEDLLEDSDIAIADGEKSLAKMATEDAGNHSDHHFKYSNDTSDLRLIVERKPLYVSRVVLSLVSPIMKSLFAIKDAEDTVELPLPGKKYTHMVQFLNCIYPDILAPITEDNVEVVLPLADEFQVRRLVEKCEEFLIKDIEDTAPALHPEKIVRYMNISEKYGLENLQKSTFETAAKTPSSLLENVREFWDLPSVTTTSVFIRRLKLLEQSGKAVRTKVKEIQNHCSLYHKGERNGESVCTKCYASIGKHAQSELKYF
ncbi:BTB and MATH domain-containing protein 38-like [Mercenaria mercenaria]|uniref:BTB and MATH domain-containing protein 38-like n=1 Tax=Mercenaria mercenaria TaxID=6596 RepID=UPI001E1E12F3|nr:BTB and MATH domain-containing protein 38-like [Mercenaria mercenaria]